MAFWQQTDPEAAIEKETRGWNKIELIAGKCRKKRQLEAQGSG
jgi:hypothetical protein